MFMTEGDAGREETLVIATQTLSDMLQQLTFGDHLCLIYRNKKDQFAVVIPFIRQGLENGEKCLYIVDERTAHDVKEALAQEGSDVEACLASGQLTLLVKEETYLKEGFFDPDKMIALLIESTEAALQEGYSGLRVTGEMTWVLSERPGSDRLIEYEAKLNRIFPGSKSLAICQYNETRFSPELLIDVLATHPLVVIDGLVTRNFYFVPPEEFLREKRNPAMEYTRYLHNIQERENLHLSLEMNNKELEGKVSELQEAQKRSTFFIDLMTHDLTNINQGIMASLELIQYDSTLPNNLINSIQLAVDQVERGTELIGNVKRFATIDAEPPRLEKKEIFLPLIAATQIVKQKFHHKELQVETKIRQDQYHVLANGLLTDMFFDLLHYIMRYDRNEQVVIEVAASPAQDKDFLKIEINNRNLSIPDEEKEHIFARLAGIKGGKRGSGIGLTLVQRLIDRYEGSIRVENRIKGDPTQGTNFVLLLRRGN